MIDVANLANPAALSAADFTFAAGNDADPTTYPAAPAPKSITIRPGAGVAGSDRITLLWSDNAIQNEWLRVTVNADADTGLPSPDVFYFGNLIGDTGNSPSSPADVTVADIALTKSLSGQSAPITSVADFNRSGQITVADIAIAKAYQGNTLPLLAAPPSAPPLLTAALAPAAQSKPPVPEASFTFGLEPIPTRRRRHAPRWLKAGRS
jgi:hypothetical protein